MFRDVHVHLLTYSVLVRVNVALSVRMPLKYYKLAEPVLTIAVLLAGA